jgi:hypothetical protein
MKWYGMKIRLRCVHTSHISCAIWVCQLLFLSSSFIAKALCGCVQSLFVTIWQFAFYFGLDLLLLLLWFDGGQCWRFGGAFLIAWKKWAGEDWSVVGEAQWRWRHMRRHLQLKIGG